jgi:hypothetical protein
MSAARTLSITLTPELLLKAEERAALEHSTVDEIVGHALERYVELDPEWEAILRETRAAGRRLGITSEEDVERLSDEWRRERRR